MEDTTNVADSELANLVSAELTDTHITRIKSILETIISQGSKFENAVDQSLNILLQKDNTALQCMAAQAIAEICKCEKKRVSYAYSEIVQSLLSLLGKPICQDNIEVMKQCCRGLGNICFDNYVGRDLVLNSSGIPVIVEMLSKTLECEDNIKIPCHNVRLFTCKLLSILMFGGNIYIKPVLDSDFMEKIHKVIQYEFSSSDGDDDRLHSALLVLSIVIEHNRSIVTKSDLTLLIVEILKTIKNMEISEICLEYLHYQAEHDDVKTLFAKSSLPQILWSLLKQHRSLAVDEETRELMKIACDLIALILTGDESMNILYADGNGDFYLSMIEGLNCDDVELAITPILAVGNFARTDTHCLHMMDTGVFSKLMSILILHKNHEDDIRLQHLVLSGLRNLVIPQRNKSLAIKHGILPVLIEMIPNVSQYPVVFKLLATLRMLVDGQESVAKELISADTLNKFAIWGAQSEHAGVSGEASRLLARMIRQLQSHNSLINIAKVEGCISCLVNMLAASHVIMQNEAIIALTILCTTILSSERVIPLENHKLIYADNASDEKNSIEVENTSSQEMCDVPSLLINSILKADLAKQLNIMLERNCLKVQPEIAENICKFIFLLSNTKSLNEQMSQNQVQESLQKLVTENNQLSQNIQSSLNELISKINSVGCNSD